MDIYKNFSERTPMIFLPEVADILCKLGNIHRNLHNDELSQNRFIEALDIYRMLAKKNPKEYKPLVEYIQRNILNENPLSQYSDLQKEEPGWFKCIINKILKLFR